MEEDDKGIHVAWIDNSPEALRRQDAVRKKERQDRGDEEREQAAIREQVLRARKDAEERGETELDEAERELKRAEGEKIKLSFGSKPAAPKWEPFSTDLKPLDAASPSAAATSSKDDTLEDKSLEKPQEAPTDAATSDTAPAVDNVSLKMGFSAKPKNVFSAAKKNALGGKKTLSIKQPKKISEAERIMREEMDQKNKRGPSGFGSPPQKKSRF